MISKMIVWGALLFLLAAPACRAADAPRVGDVHIDAYFFSAQPETTPALMGEYLQELSSAFLFQFEKVQGRQGKHYVIHPMPRPLKTGVVPAPADIFFEQNGHYSLLIAEGEEGGRVVETLLAEKIEPAVVFLLRVPEPQKLRFPAATGKVVNYLFYGGGVQNMLTPKPKDTRLQNIVVSDTQEFRLDNPVFRKLLRETQLLAVIEALQTRGKQTPELQKAFQFDPPQGTDEKMKEEKKG